MKKNGFTLIELIVTLAIITVVSVVMFTSLFGWKSQTDLVNVTKQAGALLREAASNAMTQEKGTAWGVHFDNATDTTPFYALFASSTYSTSSVVGSYNLPASIGYLTSTLPVGSSKDIAFEHLSGDASASTSIGLYLLDDPTQSSTISVASTGAVSYLNPPPAATFAGGYLYSRAVTIDHTKVSSTDQTDFPVLFSGTYSYLATAAHGGDVKNSSGYDIIFASDAAGANTLPFEQESYDPTTGAVNYWVQVPTLSHISDTVIYMFYGNPSVTTSQANPAGVWSSGYAGVWHLPNGTTLSAGDSTANANNGTISGATATTGKIDGGASFNGSADIALASNTTLEPTSITISAWAYSTATNLQVLMGKRESAGTTAPTSYGLSQRSSNTMWFTIGDGGNTEAYAASTGVQQNTWQYWVGTYDGATLSLYLNGVLQSTASYTGGIIYSSDFPAYLGYYPYGSSYNWNGSIDEARISSVARPADWIATDYNNESSPSTFYAVGAQITP